jgi:endonuclease V-like protein UPF0215 family
MRLTEIKKEIRILGLSCISKDTLFHLFGVVYRGAKWLDGVISSSTCETEITKAIIELILNSKHYRQIRIITIHKKYLPNNTQIDPETISQKLQIPIISISTDQNDYCFKYDEKIYIRSYLIEEKKTREVLQKTTLINRLPEALRVSWLIAQKFALNTEHNL